MKLIAFILVSSSIFSQKVELKKIMDNQFILQSNNCDQLIKNRDALCSWSNSLNENRTSSQRCEETSEGLKQINISSCLPSFSKNNHQRKLYNHGANCWGTVLNLKGISSRPRFVWSEEMTYWLNSPICRKLKPEEGKKPGDILNIYGPEYIFEDQVYTKANLFWDTLFPERRTVPPINLGYTGFHHFLHSEIFITDDISFGKDSPNKNDRFKFQSTKEIYGRPRHRSCQEKQNMTPHFREYSNQPIENLRSEKCNYFSIAYRCENIMDYFEKENLNFKDRIILKEIKTLQDFQRELFNLLIQSSSKINSLKINSLLYLIEKQSKQALIGLNEKDLNKIREMLLTLKYFSAQGIRKSLELAGIIQR